MFDVHCLGECVGGGAGGGGEGGGGGGLALQAAHQAAPTDGIYQGGCAYQHSQMVLLISTKP